MLDFDNQYRNQGYKYLAGIDEAGRGPWAGPVVSASVILDRDFKFYNSLNDSKLLTPKKRKELFEIIKQESVAFTIYSLSADDIDKVNILMATKITMRHCIENLKVQPDMILVDGNFKVPDINIKQESIISGDKKSGAIAAASILAKVSRDNMMEEYDKIYPQYQFKKHKGYGTALHKQLLQKHGPCKIHRKSYKPIKVFL